MAREEEEGSGPCIESVHDRKTCNDTQLESSPLHQGFPTMALPRRKGLLYVQLSLTHLSPAACSPIDDLFFFPRFTSMDGFACLRMSFRDQQGPSVPPYFLTVL